MRKLSSFLAASLGMAWVTAAGAQQAPDMFKDLDPNHWAYQATENLRSKGILIGYPDGYFRGKRTLTRYEFAVALDRLLKNLPSGPAGPPGQPGAQGERGTQGERGDQGPPGMTPEEVANLRRLTQEFRDELAALGNNMAAVNRRLDAMAKDIADIRDILSKMPKLSFFAFTGFRSDKSTGTYVDHDGRFSPIAGGSAGPEFVHLFGANVAGNIAGGAKYSATLATGTLHGYEGGSNSFAQTKPIFRDAASETFLTEAALTAPFSSIGRGSNITIGRQGLRLGRLTLWRPDTDTYFMVPFLDDGTYTIDGVNLTTNFGSVSFQAVGGLTRTVQTSLGTAYNSPLAGAAFDGAIFGVNSPSTGLGPVVNSKPVGQPDLGQMTVDSLAAISLGLNIHQLQGGHIRFTAMDTANAGFEPNFGGARPFTGSGVGFKGVTVLGSDIDLKLADKLSLTADWGKTITHLGRLEDTVGTHNNNAFNANLGWSSGALNLTAGYKYIDPMFYAPGYWGRIGNWLNPTNVQGPTVRAGYNIRNGLGVNVGGDFFSAARSRASVGGLGRDDDIKRILVGLHWDVAKNFQTTIDWEGVYWHLEGAHAGIPALGGGTTNPTEHYIRIGTGYHLTSGTLIRLLYEIGEFDGHGVLNNGVPGATRNSYNAASASFSVKF